MSETEMRSDENYGINVRKQCFGLKMNYGLHSGVKLDVPLPNTFGM